MTLCNRYQLGVKSNRFYIVELFPNTSTIYMKDRDFVREGVLYFQQCRHLTKLESTRSMWNIYLYKTILTNNALQYERQHYKMYEEIHFNITTSLKFRFFLNHFVSHNRLHSSWSWLHGSWIYNYLYNQCLSPLSGEFELRSWRGELDTALRDKVCQWLTTGRWFSLGTPVSSTNKTDLHDITEILLKVWYCIDSENPREDRFHWRQFWCRCWLYCTIFKWYRP
jgi:hypothetical protein